MEAANEFTAERMMYDRIITAQPSGKKEVTVKKYDFKRPDKFSLDQIRTVWIMHETFCRLVEGSLSGALRTIVNSRIVSVDQLNFEEFTNSIPNPAALAVIGMDPLKGTALLEIDPNITFGIIDRVFGGNGEDLNLSRDLSDIERSVMEPVFMIMLSCLGESWSTVIGLRPRLASIETNIQYAQIVPPMEMVMLVSIEITIGEIKGFINLCLPYLTIEPIIGKLSAQYWYSSIRKTNTVNSNPVAALLTVDALVIYPTASLSLVEIDEIIKGKPLKLDSYKEGNAVLEAGGSVVLNLKRDTSGFSILPGYDEKLPGLTIDNELKESSIADLLKQQNQIFEEEIRSLAAGMEKGFKAFNEKLEELSGDMMLGARNTETLDHVPGKKTVPFSFITDKECDLLFTFVQQEHPQLIALILTYLQPQTSSVLLGKFSQHMQTDVIRRIAVINEVHPDVLKKIEGIIEHKINITAGNANFYNAGGIQRVVEILNYSTRAVERNVVETLEKENPQMAQSIKQRMFVFEDIVMLDKKAFKSVITNTNKNDLAAAMKMTPEEVKAFVFSCMEADEAALLKKEIDELGRVRLTDVEESQQRIVNTIRVMEENGLIIVARADELVD